MTASVRRRWTGAMALWCTAIIAWCMLAPGPHLALTAQPPKPPTPPPELLNIPADAPPAVAELFRALAVPHELYEQQALERIADFEKAAADLPALQRLTTVEKALTVVLRFSLATRERPLKGEGPWDAVQKKLQVRLLDARLRLLRQRTALAHNAETWQHALHDGDDLIAAYPGDSKVAAEAARLRLRFATSLLLHTAGDTPAAAGYGVIRRQLEWVDEHLPQPPGPDPLDTISAQLIQPFHPIAMICRADAVALRKHLVGKATALLAEARRTPDARAAIPMLEAALEIWPHLPDLRDQLLKRQGKFTILNVGVRTLPQYLSPEGALADSELQALELLFEGLLQTRPAGDDSLTIVPQLATSLPRLLDNERQFSLRKTAFWSNGTRVTSADVQKTVELLTNPNLPGHSGELALQLEESLRTTDDRFRVDARLRQGLLDPLAPFTFKVLPREYQGAILASADSEAFAPAPLGSGPYMLHGTKSEKGRTYVSFVANPWYVGRHEPDGPKIREVRFFVSKDPAFDFARKEAPMHLLLDVSAQDRSKLKATRVAEVRTFPTRRVFFLAVNHRQGVLADETPLRRALAHGINRDQVLADCFGGGRPSFRTAGIAAWGSTLPVMAAALLPKGTAAHHALNGLYPAGSWAACPDSRVPASLFDPAKAEAFLKDAKNKQYELELKYPDDDPRVGDACKLIKAQLADLGDRAGRPITVRLVPLPPRQLKQDLQKRDYQLAYWHYDYPNDSYSLWPLFDTRPEALAVGSNYLGFKGDGTLVQLLQNAASFRDFRQVKEKTHLIHVALYEEMPLIPLWQLDFSIAVHPQLKLPAIDPLRVFSNIDEWQLVPK